LQGVHLLFTPAIAFIIIYVVIWALASFQEKKFMQPPSLADIPLLGWTAAACWVAALMGLLDSLGGSWFMKTFPWLFAVILAAGSVALTLLIVAPFAQSSFARIFFG